MTIAQTRPSIPFPETQERRAAISRDISAATGLDDAVLERLVRVFYAAARQDPMLGPLFDRVRDWQAHIAKITSEPRTTCGSQPWYSALAILTALTLRTVFRLAFRQAEGLIGSIVGLLGLDLRAPDHTTLSRRAATPDMPPRRTPALGLAASPCTCWWTARA